MDSWQGVGVHQGPVQEVDPDEAFLDDVKRVGQESDEDAKQQNDQSQIQANPFYLAEIVFFDLLTKDFIS